jgi:hypothetical protein
LADVSILEWPILGVMESFTSAFVDELTRILRSGHQHSRSAVAGEQPFLSDHVLTDMARVPVDDNVVVDMRFESRLDSSDVVVRIDVTAAYDLVLLHPDLVTPEESAASGAARFYSTMIYEVLESGQPLPPRIEI